MNYELYILKNKHLFSEQLKETEWSERATILHKQITMYIILCLFYDSIKMYIYTTCNETNVTFIIITLYNNYTVYYTQYITVVH